MTPHCLSNVLYAYYSCVNLYDMLRFHSILFFNFIEGLTTIEHTSCERFPAHDNLTPNRLASWRRLLDSMLTHSEQIGLRTVPAHLKILQAAATSGQVTNADLNRAANILRDIIQAELSHHLLFVIPQSDAELFSGQPMGDEIYSRFPSARRDITEAAKALALDRTTAAVLHLMRVLEVGLNVLARYLRIPYKHSNWELIINQIPTRIQGIESAKRKPKDWRNMRQFLSEAGSDFRLLKDAFRNWAMHAHAAYDERAAREIFAATKAFMRHLATKLSE